MPWLEGAVQDVRYAIRSLRRSRAFTLTAIATLANRATGTTGRDIRKLVLRSRSAATRSWSRH